MKHRISNDIPDILPIFSQGIPNIFNSGSMYKIDRKANIIITTKRCYNR